MTKWAVIFEDTPGMLEIRKQKLEQHLVWLAEHSERILIAGGLRITPDAPFTGGLWIVDAAEYDDVVALVLEDPFYAPLHRKFTVHAWNKASKPLVTL
ncbi:MAG: hypothetical protein JKX94_09510 [Sneathiella sp.]|nr:hypothetical protein [Sneathiella sp.]